METSVIDPCRDHAPQLPAARPAAGRARFPGTARAVLFDGNGSVRLEEVALSPPGPGDVVVEVLWSGISTGTERLMWSGQMPSFPGLSYPLVPGYEAVGRIIHAPDSPGRIGQMVFVPGSRGFRDVSGLFGGAASCLVVPQARLCPISLEDPSEAVLFALAATAHHAIAGSRLPGLIIGHGVLGRLCARLVIALGGRPPTVWETNPARRQPQDYPVVSPDEDDVRNYSSVCDLSGDSAIIDKVLPHCERGAQITLAGFYPERCSFSFPLAFMKEIRLSVAAEWLACDLSAVGGLLQQGRLSLSGLITHLFPAAEAPAAYAAAFSNPDCLKTVLCWGDPNG